MTRKRVALLISGRGSNMTALIEAAKATDYPAEIVGVFSNRPDAPGLAIAAAEGIATASRSHKDFPSREAFDDHIQTVLDGWGAQIVCLAGFMRIFSTPFAERWTGRMLNIHPSLLPLYKGLRPHDQALAAGATEHGCTVHWVIPQLDDGPAILQVRIPVLPDDTADSLAARVLVEEHKLYPRALAMVARGEAWLDVEKSSGAPTTGMSTFADDDLTYLEAHGIPPLPPGAGDYVDTGGARIWYASYGSGAPVILLHGGLGNAGNWGHQVPALVHAGYRAIVIDSRGQGRSTRDARPYTYELMAFDTRAVMDALGVARAAFIGWSDGADTALVLSKETPERSAGVFFFACNVDNTGTRPFKATPVIDRIYHHHVREYASLSPVIGGFEAMRDDLNVMQDAQPDYGEHDLREITVPVWSVLGENDEFIKREHAQYIAQTIPGARFVLLPEVSHFAPLQRPAEFNRAMLDFLAGLGW